MKVAVLALVVVVGLALPGGATAAQDPPVGLLPVPDPLPPGPPGSVVDSEPFAVDPYPFAVEGHQLLYRSTDRFGTVSAVSGALLVPTGVPAPPGGRPVVAVPHGTVGISDGCAPSVGVQYDGGVVYDDVGALLAGGAIVVATDYHGLGTPGVHPYLDGVDAGRAVLDSIRAARDFGGTGPAAVSGLSQGGHATLYAGSEHTAGYAPDVDL
ncbi:MAG TPA: lipase family protein, partial [Iamia sp.]